LTPLTRYGKLGASSRVAIVGGGPAGSFFAIYLLQRAQERRLDIQVDIYEPRDFASNGPRGCNRCAGILSASLLKNLQAMNITVPPEVTQGKITSYQLCSPFGTAEVKNPDPQNEIFSVYRGGGPLHLHGQEIASFDGFLLGRAQELGASVVPLKVQRISLQPAPSVYTESSGQEYDLVVLSAGLNAGDTQIEGLPYQRPPTMTMSQDEIYAEREDVQRFFGSSVKVVLLPGSGLIFGTLVPKGHFINVSLLGAGRDWRVEDFLSQDLVKRVLPFPYERSCGCRPKICVGMASHYYADGFVAVGDACVARLYKDGIGSALLTARQAAQTALDEGISADSFARHYAPAARAIHRDNSFGKVIFATHRRIKESPAFFRAQSRLLDDEQSHLQKQEPFTRALWGIFTGSYAYRKIAGMALSPNFVMPLATGYLREKLAPEAPLTVPAFRGATPEGTGVRHTKILVLGGGFGGIYTVLRLVRALRNRRDVSLTLVSDENFFLFTPMLQEVATGAIETRHIAYPVRRLRHARSFQFVQGTVLDVDLQEKRVFTERGALDYDYLVLALGSVTDMTGLPGRARNVLTLKSLLDGMLLRNHMISMLEQADVEQDPERRKQLLTFAVAGGGYTGIQLITEMRDFIRGSLLRAYRTITDSEISILLIEGQERILPGNDERLAQKIAGFLQRQGIEIRTGCRVTDVREDRIQLNGEEWLPTSTVVWAAGIRANPVVSGLPVETDALGRVRVNGHLEVLHFPGVYALGDNAWIVHPVTGEALPPRAHFAVRQPKTVVANIMADLTGTSKELYRPGSDIQMISLGSRNAALSFHGIHLFGLPMRLIWILGYLSLVTGLYNRIRIIVDWLLILFFRRDSTLLRIETREG